MGLEELLGGSEKRILKRSFSKARRVLKKYQSNLLMLGFCASFAGTIYGLSQFTPEQRAEIRQVMPLESEFDGAINTFLKGLGIGSLGGAAIGYALEKKKSKKDSLACLDDALFSYPKRNSRALKGIIGSAYALGAYQFYSKAQVPIYEVPLELNLFALFHIPTVLLVSSNRIFDLFSRMDSPRFVNGIRFIGEASALYLKDKDRNAKLARIKKLARISNDDQYQVLDALSELSGNELSNKAKAELFHVHLGDYFRMESMPSQRRTLSTSQVARIISPLRDELRQMQHALSDFSLGYYSHMHTFMELARSTHNAEAMLGAAAFNAQFLDEVAHNPKAFSYAGLCELIEDAKNPLLWIENTKQGLFREVIERLTKEVALQKFKGRTKFTHPDRYSGDFFVFKEGEFSQLQNERELTRALITQIKELDFAEPLCLIDYESDAYLVLRRKEGSSLYECSDLEAYKKVARAHAKFHKILGGEKRNYGKVIARRVQDHMRSLPAIEKSADWQRIWNMLPERVGARDGHADQYLVSKAGITSLDHEVKGFESEVFDSLRLANQGFFKGDLEVSRVLNNAYCDEAGIDSWDFHQRYMHALPYWALGSAFAEVNGPVGSSEQKLSNLQRGMQAAQLTGNESVLEYLQGAIAQLT